MARSWSLARRIRWTFAATTTVLALVVAGVSALAVRAATERELGALASEELDEMRALFSVSGGSRAEFAALSDELGQRHPANPMAWRVWNPETGESWGDFGEVELLEELSQEDLARKDLVPLGRSLRWKSEDLTPELVCGLLFDGSSQLRLPRNFDLLALGMVLAAGVFSCLAGAVIGRRVSGMLDRVASRVRRVRDPSEPVQVDVEGAPNEIRQVAEALDQMLANLRAETENNQLIVSGLAHELRSPIQNLMGSAEVALLRERGGAEYREVLEGQIEELRSLGRVVDNLVTLCAAGENRRSRLKERFDLGQELELRLQREKSHAQRHAVSLAVETDGDLELEGDREALLLALRNLVTNAIDWAGEDGSVRVRLAGGREEADGLEILVDDDGPGVPSEERERIFQPFHSGRRANGARLGYGLGLALTRSAVESHGGTIEVEDSPLGGARFRVVLPRSAHAAGERER